MVGNDRLDEMKRRGYFEFQPMLPNQPQLLLQQQKQKRVPTQPTFNVDDDSGNKICEIFSSSFESDENVVADAVFAYVAATAVVVTVATAVVVVAET